MQYSGTESSANDATKMIVSLEAGTSSTMHGVYTSTGTPRSNFNYIELRESDSCVEQASIRTTTTSAVIGAQVPLSVILIAIFALNF